MVRSLLLVGVQEELNLREIPRPYISLIDEQIEERMKNGVEYIKKGRIRYVNIDRSFLPKIGKEILQNLPDGLVDDYKIHPHTETFSYNPLATLRSQILGIEDEEDMLEYQWYATATKFSSEKLYSLEAFRVLGITGIFYYCTFFGWQFYKKHKFPSYPLISHFKGGVTEKGSNVSFIAMVGHSFERIDKDLVRSTALTSVHELGHTWGLGHNLPHSDPCIMRVDENKSDKFCSICLEKLLTDV